jgi:T5orf172 domain-containing protein
VSDTDRGDYAERGRKSWETRRANEAGGGDAPYLAGPAREVLERLAASPSGSLARAQALAGLGVPEDQFDWQAWGMVKAGWMTRRAGTWTITDAGRASLTDFPELVDWYREREHLYQLYVAGKSETREQQRAVLAEATAEAERAGVAGIYAYCLPTYREHPDQDTGRFPIKVGRSDVDVHNRFAAQKRLTWLPEEPELLRVFTCDTRRSLVDLERRLHDALDAAGHARAHGSRVGNEWFITTVEFLDSLAELAALQIIKVGDPVALEEDDDFFGGREALDDQAFAEQVQLAHDQLVETGREPTAAAIRTSMRAAGYRASKNRVLRFLPSSARIDESEGATGTTETDPALAEIPATRIEELDHSIATRGGDRPNPAYSLDPPNGEIE